MLKVLKIYSDGGAISRTNGEFDGFCNVIGFVDDDAVPSFSRSFYVGKATSNEAEYIATSCFRENGKFHIQRESSSES